ncbi:uncharacterized protein LOC130697026 [Daphnia carinata]|uniref:uncharacterized protein LOC130697026 n=1 Tax=Daphnia carinata TaxID=120202 RepID=UPI00258060FE|nr:uncharacterized protein LOC130697026 [Daphnia carinata]
MRASPIIQGEAPPQLSSRLKMADGNYVETVGILNITVNWETKSETLKVPLLQELSHELILGVDWIQRIGGISLFPNGAHLIVKAVTKCDHSKISSDVIQKIDTLYVFETTILPAMSLAFIPAQERGITGALFSNSKKQLWVVNRSFSAKPGNEWIIPNCLLPNLGNTLYIPVINPSMKPITFHIGKDITVAERIPITYWPQFLDETIGSFTRGSPTENRLSDALSKHLDGMPNQYRSAMKALLTRYHHLFYHDSNATYLKSTNTTEHHIDTGNHTPIRTAPYRVSRKEREAIQSQVTNMLQDDIIQPSSSPWASPVVMVPKKNGELRFCIDYRRLNAITVRDVYPLPRVDDFLDHLGGAQVFTSLDLKSGYWQVPMNKDSVAPMYFGA